MYRRATSRVAAGDRLVGLGTDDCHHRALQLRRHGLRERTGPVPAARRTRSTTAAALVGEALDAPEPEMPAHDLVELRREQRAR